MPQYGSRGKKLSPLYFFFASLYYCILVCVLATWRLGDPKRHGMGNGGLRGESPTKRVAELAQLSDATHAALAAAMGRKKIYPAGFVVCQQGDACDGLFFLCRGTASATAPAGDGRAPSVAHDLHPGAFTSADPLLHKHGAGPETVICTSKCTWQQLSRDRFYATVREVQPEAMVELLRAKKSNLTPAITGRQILPEEGEEGEEQQQQQHPTTDHVSILVVADMPGIEGKAEFILSSAAEVLVWARAKIGVGDASHTTVGGLKKTCAAVTAFANAFRALDDKHTGALALGEHVVFAIAQLRRSAAACPVSSGRVRQEIEAQIADFGAAVERATKAIETQIFHRGGFLESSTRALYHLGNHLLAAWGEVDAAESAYRTALRADGEFAWCHLVLGHLLRHRRDAPHCLAGAEACYRAAITAEPTFALAHLHLADVLLDPARGGGVDVDGAESAFRLAIIVDGHCADSHCGLATLLASHKGQLQEAVAMYRHALHIDHHHAPSQQSLEVALRQLEDLGLADPQASQHRPWGAAAKVMTHLWSGGHDDAGASDSAAHDGAARGAKPARAPSPAKGHSHHSLPSWGKASHKANHLVDSFTTATAAPSTTTTTTEI